MTPEEARQVRARQTRRDAVLVIRCVDCRSHVGAVHPSDEGLVLMALSSLGPRRSDQKARLSDLKANGEAQMARNLSAIRELVIALEDDPLETTVRCECSRTRRHVDWGDVRKAIRSNLPDLRV